MECPMMKTGNSLEPKADEKKPMMWAYLVAGRLDRSPTARPVPRRCLKPPANERRHLKWSKTLFVT
jgi:hypothetical protein